jgi:hypothetical protein
MRDDENWDEFVRSVGDAEASSIMENVIEAGISARQGGKFEGVLITRSESLDREGANHSFEGVVATSRGNREFRVENGNLGGTVVLSWEATDMEIPRMIVIPKAKPRNPRGPIGTWL